MRSRVVLFIALFTGVATAQTRGPLDLANAPRVSLSVPPLARNQ